MHKIDLSFRSVIQWLTSRVLVIYVIIFIFCLTCMDLKLIEERIKVRHLNDAIPDFSDMIIFSQDQNARKDIDWTPYQDYFELILSYIPNDQTTEQLLGLVDCYSGREEKAIALFKSSSDMKGKFLFWSNYNLGVIYYRKEMWPQAAKYLLNAISSNAKLTLALMQDSIIYRQITASPFFKYSLSDGISDAQSRSYILLLSCLHQMKEYDKMIGVANLGIENQKVSYKDAFYYYEGLAFYEKGQFKNAFLLFQKSLSMEKDNPDVYYYIADIFQKVGQLEQARDLLQLSYSLHQKNDPRFPYEAHVNLRFF